MADRFAAPLGDVELHLRFPPALLEGLPPDAETVRWRRWRCSSGADGGFAWEAAPRVPGLALLARKRGYRAGRRVLSTFEGHYLVLDALGEGEDPRSLVEGFVVHVAGAPAPGARVSLGAFETLSAEDGWFRLPRDVLAVDAEGAFHWPRSSGVALTAVLDRFVPATLPGVLTRLESGELREPLELVLGPPSTVIAGFLVGAAGEPAPGWRIALLGGEVVEVGMQRPLTAEDLAAGDGGRRSTGEGGAFRFEGLTAGRLYRLRAWNEETLQVAESDEVPAGTHGYVLRVPFDPPRPLVDGVVRGHDGHPLEGVRVRLTMVEHRHEGGTWMHTGQRAVTGADGRFEFREVPHVDLHLRFDQGGTAGGRLDLPPGEPGRGLEVVLSRAGGFRLHLPEAIPGRDQIAVLDRDGERLRLQVRVSPATTRGMGLYELTGETTPEIHVLDRAAAVVVLRDGREFDRLPLEIRPGELVEVGGRGDSR